MDRITVGENTLHFGMTAIRIWQEKCQEEVKRLNGGKPDNVKAFAYLIHAGLCNYQDTIDGVHPSFESSYAIAEEILFMPEDIQKSIWDCFNNSRAGKPLLDALTELTGTGKAKKKVR